MNLQPAYFRPFPEFKVHFFVLEIFQKQLNLLIHGHLLSLKYLLLFQKELFNSTTVQLTRLCGGAINCVNSMCLPQGSSPGPRLSSISSIFFKKFLIFLSFVHFPPGVSFNEAKQAGLASSLGTGPMPREMSFPVPKGGSWHDLYDYIRWVASSGWPSNGRKRSCKSERLPGLVQK